MRLLAENGDLKIVAMFEDLFDACDTGHAIAHYNEPLHRIAPYAKRVPLRKNRHLAIRRGISSNFYWDQLRQGAEYREANRVPDQTPKTRSFRWRATATITPTPTD